MKQTKIKTRLDLKHQHLKMENLSFKLDNTTETTNNTTNEEEEEDIIFSLFLLCISLVTITVGLIGNGIVIFLTGCRMKRTVNSIWSLNLAIADFIFILSSVLQPFLYLGKWGSDSIKYIVFIIRLYLSASTFFLAVISLDRCLCIWKAVWAQNNRTLFRAKIICGIVWIFSISYTLIFSAVWENGLFVDVTWNLVCFVIPFLIIASSYIAIGLRIKRLKMGKKLRLYWSIIIINLAFFLCRIPFCVFQLCLVIEEKDDWRDSQQIAILKALLFSLYLVYLHSCLNPFLYVLMCDDYKKQLKQSLLLVLETAFAEDHLNIKADRNGQRGQENQI